MVRQKSNKRHGQKVISIEEFWRCSKSTNLKEIFEKFEDFRRFSRDETFSFSVDENLRRETTPRSNQQKSRRTERNFNFEQRSEKENFLLFRSIEKKFFSRRNFVLRNWKKQKFSSWPFVTFVSWDRCVFPTIEISIVASKTFGNFFICFPIFFLNNADICCVSVDKLLTTELYFSKHSSIVNQKLSKTISNFGDRTFNNFFDRTSSTCSSLFQSE